MGRRSVVVVGDVILDRDLSGRVERFCPDAPAPVLDVESDTGGPGGAGLAALLCRTPGVDVTLVACLGDDAVGQRLRDELSAADVRLVALAQAGPTRTKTRVRSLGQSLVRLDEGGPAAPVGPLPMDAVEAIERADVVLVSCYGAGVTAHEGLRSLLTSRARGRPVVWDPHPRGGPPVPACCLVTPNLPEARDAAGMPAGSGDEVARHLVGLWSARSVCVTAGPSGAWLASSAGEPVHVPTSPRQGDPCGAGDRFAAAATTAIALGRTTSEAVVTAVEQASAWVAAGGSSAFRERQRLEPAPVPRAGVAPSSTSPSLDELRTRGTLVATGGCFDILHAGHVACLQAARELGDSLVVLLNSDSSVRRLKGSGRPVQRAEDRARVLLGLACVDAVVVFDEDSPAQALASLRPDVWVKGGDYEGTELEEAELVRGWGGRVVLVPYLADHSTTAILDGVR